jgi:UDP-glucuronate 4-epimerase
VRVVVTGGAGFVGTALVARLLAAGHRVDIVDRLDATYDPEPRRRRARAPLHVMDTRDALPILRGADAVIHLAARPGVRESMLDPLATVRENVEGTAALLRDLREAGVPRLVFASSSSVYGARRGEIFRETDPADKPESVYGASKRAGELLCHAAHATTGLHVCVARLFTVYGPAQRPTMAIARFVRQARASEDLTVFGDGSSVRDYTYVDDAADALAAAAERAEGYRIVNVGGGAPVTLNGLLDAIEVGTGPLRRRHLPEQPGDVPETRADISAARDWLGWSPKVGIEEGIRRYVRWVEAGEP